MSLWRFLTEPSLRFSHFGVFLTTVVVTGATVFLLFYMDGKGDRAREERHSARVARLRQDLSEARADVRHLKAETKRNGTAQSRPASLKVSSETAAAPLTDDNVDTIASIARAKRYHEWDLRRKDHKERDIALAKKELAHGDALLANSNKRGEIILAVYARMSPEQLEAERKELLKTQPAEEVDRFLRQVKELGTAKSPEEIEQALLDFKKTRETLLIKRQELVAEREQLNREWEELQRTKPLPPNLGLDEFYTEWKKRNRTKPKP